MHKSPYEAACEAANYLSQFGQAPQIAVILGSGLGEFGTTLHNATTIPYTQIPYFPRTSVKGHAGELVIGQLTEGGPNIVALRGRSHLYEGHPPAEIVHPTRALWKWGIKGIVYTNAAGAIHPKLQPGDLMLITDHINCTGKNPLVGPNDDRLGPRFPDMSQAYDIEFLDTFQKTARELNIRVQKGSYLSLMGPSYETPAEINAYAEMGAYAVGMSTVLSVIAARHVGLRVAGISCITNFGAGISNGLLSHDEVKETANLVKLEFMRLLREGLASLSTLV